MRYRANQVEGLGTFIIVMVFVILAALVAFLLVFMIRRSRKMQAPAVTLSGRVLEKHATAMGEEEVVLELADGTRKRYRMLQGKVLICPGDCGIFEIRGEFITGFRR